MFRGDIQLSLDILLDILLPIYVGADREQDLIEALGGKPNSKLKEEEKERREKKGDPLGFLFDD